jgi:glutaconate CoA-transferase subunit A
MGTVAPTAAGPVVTLDALVARIVDGTHLAIPVDFNAFFSGAAMEVTRRLIRAGRRDLRLLCVPSNGLQADILIGAGCVAEIEAGAMLMPELGTPPRFVAATRAGRVRSKDTTCPAIFHGLGAAEKGVSFMPVAGIVGSDLLKTRDDWRVIADPYDSSLRQLVVPAIRPDIALFHAPLADRHGNVWLGRRREIALLAHAARRTLVTVERIVDEDLMNTPLREDGTLSGVYVEAVAECPDGSWPLSAGNEAPGDPDAMREYFEMAKSDAGFKEYLERFLANRRVPA